MCGELRDSTSALASGVSTKVVGLKKTSAVLSSVIPDYTYWNDFFYSKPPGP